MYKKLKQMLAKMTKRGRSRKIRRKTRRKPRRGGTNPVDTSGSRLVPAGAPGIARQHASRSETADRSSMLLPLSRSPSPNPSPNPPPNPPPRQSRQIVLPRGTQQK